MLTCALPHAHLTVQVSRTKNSRRRRGRSALCWAQLSNWAAVSMGLGCFVGSSSAVIALRGAAHLLWA